MIMLLSLLGVLRGTQGDEESFSCLRNASWSGRRGSLTLLGNASYVREVMYNTWIGHGTPAQQAQHIHIYKHVHMYVQILYKN